MTCFCICWGVEESEGVETGVTCGLEGNIIFAQLPHVCHHR